MSRTMNAVVWVYLAVILAGGFGWMENIVKLMHMTFTNHQAIFVIRAIGIFVVPLGAVAGYF